MDEQNFEPALARAMKEDAGALGGHAEEPSPAGSATIFPLFDSS
jgi:hypothetical protein